MVACLVLVPVGLSDTLNWWGPVLQVSAVLGGLFVGRRWWHRDCPGAFMIITMLMISTAVLMQPEYFRFGQLGNLTPCHILWVMATGVAIAATCAVAIVKPRAKIHASAFVKIKWLLRFVTLLTGVLFALTEAVPIFLAMVAMVFLLCGLSVWHADKKTQGLFDYLLALSICLFGCLISVPTITSLGVLLLAFLPEDVSIKDGRFLL